MNDFFIKTLLNFTLKDSNNEIYIPLEKAIEIFKQKLNYKDENKKLLPINGRYFLEGNSFQKTG